MGQATTPHLTRFQSTPGGVTQFFAARLHADGAKGHAPDPAGILERAQHPERLLFRVEILKDAEREEYAVAIVKSQQCPPQFLDVNDQDIRNLESIPDLIQGRPAEGAANEYQSLLP